MDSNENDCRLFPQDADIGGIGVRASFYLQCFVLVLLIALSSKESSSALWTLIATSLGLQIAAIIRYTPTNTGDPGDRLSLFQAIQVSNLVWMANICIVIGLASYSRRRPKKLTQRDVLVQISAGVEILMSVILSFVLWGTSPRFGNDQCAEITPFLLLKWNIGATTARGRGLNCALIGVFFCIYAFIAVDELRRRWRERKERKRAERGRGDQDVPMIELVSADVDERPHGHSLTRTGNRTTSTEGTGSEMLSISEPQSLQGRSSQGRRHHRDRDRERQRRHHHSASPSSSNSGIRNAPAPGAAAASHRVRRKRRERSYRFSHLRPYLIGSFFVSECLILPYFVATNELLIDKSRDVGKRQWGFGQVLALIVVWPAVLTLSRTLWDLAKSRRKGGEDEEGRIRDAENGLASLARR